MIDKETGYKIIELKDKIVQNFTKSHWQELGMIIGLWDVITKHDRLLRSLSFGDDDYEGNVIEVRDDGLFATGGAFSETPITPNNLNKSVILSATGTSNHTLSGDVLKDTVTGGGNNILSVGVNGVYVPPYPGTDDVLCSDLTSVISELLDANQNNTVNSTTYDLVSFKSSIVSNCKLELISPPTGFAITGSSRVSSFGKMEWYSTLTAATNAAGSGETVLIFNDTSESLVLKNGVCYQGIGKHTISGNVTFSGSTIETSILNLKILNK